MSRLRASAEAAPSIAADAAKTTAVMVGVRETGIVRVPFTELAARFVKPLANIANSAASDGPRTRLALIITELSPTAPA